MPYGFAQRQAELENYFSTEFRKSSLALIRWDAVDFVPPVDQSWCGFAIRPAVHGVAGLVSSCHRDEGFIFVQCFAPKHEGMIELMELVDVVVPIFHGNRLNGTTFKDTDVNVLGTRDAYVSANVQVGYTSDWTN